MFKYEDVLTVLLFLPALYMWKHFYCTYKKENLQYKKQLLFHQRHNCVVIYSKTHMRGWPPEYDLKVDITNFNRFLEPYVYFIKSAKSSLNIAMMRITINPLLEALLEAVERGVEVRLIVNFLSIKSVKEKFQKLLKSGIKVIFYVDKTEKLNNIMHCKYMIKDYDTVNGYLCMGSMNFTSLTTMMNNFEDVTFTSNVGVVGQFHTNFEHAWDMINRDNENMYNKTVLKDCGLME